MAEFRSQTRAHTSTKFRWIITSIFVAVAIATFIVVASALNSRSSADRLESRPSPSAMASAPPDRSGSPSPSPTPTDSERPGSNQVEPPRAPTIDPVPIGETSNVASGITAAITSVEAVDGVAQGPGEVAGPAIRFSVTVNNNSADSISLTTTVINVDYGVNRIPAGELSGPGGEPFPAEVAPRASVTGTFVYSIPSEQRREVRITVDYSIDATPLTFIGEVPA